jgi:hypothetical protein
LRSRLSLVLHGLSPSHSIPAAGDSPFAHIKAPGARAVGLSGKYVNNLITEDLTLTRIGLNDRRKGRSAPPAALLLWGLLAAACVYDPDAKCGEGLVFYEEGARCVCPGNTIYTAEGCVKCRKNEVSNGTACECKDGFARDGASGSCKEQPMGQGVECDGTPTSCADETFNVCQVANGEPGYCTTDGCTGPSDCGGGYACDAASGVCVRPPFGMGMTCASNADCEDTAATYCDLFVSRTCLVQGCTVTPNNCFAGNDCCDLSAFGVPQPICVPAGECVTP